MSIDFSKMNVQSKEILSSKETKIGRKKLSEEVKKSEKINLYLTPSQKQQIERMAFEHYQTLSQFIISKVFS